MTDAVPGPDRQPADSDAPATSPVGIPRIGIAPVAEPVPPRTPVIRSRTLLVDSAPTRLRRAEDLLDLSLSLLGALSMLILAAYAHETTTGVTQDVQNALAAVLRQILVFPLQAIEGLVTFLVPLAVLLERVLRRSWRSTGQAAVGAVAGWGVGLLAYTLLETWGPDSVIAGLTVSGSGSAQLGVSATFAALAGLLTGAGERRSTPAARYGWVAVWLVVGLAGCAAP